jgi:hypothetical protein
MVTKSSHISVLFILSDSSHVQHLYPHLLLHLGNPLINASWRQIVLVVLVKGKAAENSRLQLSLEGTPKKWEVLTGFDVIVAAVADSNYMEA